MSVCFLILFAGLLVIAGPASGNEGRIDRYDNSPHSHRGNLHFSHPLIAESPSPDTKLRLDHFFRDKENGDENTVRLEAEYAFARWISIEADVPYTLLDPDDAGSRSNLDTVELGLKLATYVLETRGVLLGGGIEFGLPTGDDDKGIGTDTELEVEPFLDMGWKRQALEAIAFVTFGIPVNQKEEEGDAVDLELGLNVAFLYHFTPQVTVLLELDGGTIAVGDEDETVANVTSGFEYRPWRESTFELGFGVSVPITDNEEFDIRTVLSAFYHF